MTTMTQTLQMIRVTCIGRPQVEDILLPSVSSHWPITKSHIFVHSLVNIVEIPDTSVLDKSDLKIILRSQLGLSSYSSPSIYSIPKLLANREIGVNHEEKLRSAHTSFGSVDRCRLSDNFLPNKMWTIEQYPSKGFKIKLFLIIIEKIIFFIDSILWLLLERRRFVSDRLSGHQH